MEHDPDSLDHERKVPRQTAEANEQPQADHQPKPHRQGGARTGRTQNLAALSFLAAIVVGLLLYFFFPAQPTQNTSLPKIFNPGPENLPQDQTPSVNSFVQDSNTSKMSVNEQTFIAVKPDGVQRGLIGPIISRFETRGFKLVAIKLITPGKEHLEKHYEDLKSKSFFPGLIAYMNSGPICAMVWEGRDAVKTGRAILGATNPLASAPGTIRGDYCLETGRNVCHGSDSVENAKKEIALWFKEGEVLSWKSAVHDWVYEE